MLQRINEFVHSEKGQGIVEYALILAFVVAAAVVLASNGDLASAINNKLQGVINQINGSGSGS